MRAALALERQPCLRRDEQGYGRVGAAVLLRSQHVWRERLRIGWSVAAAERAMPRREPAADVAELMLVGHL